MINNFVAVGRLCFDTELKHTQGGTAYAQNTVAIQRSYTNKNGERESDFIPFSCFRASAELLHKHFKKGDLIGLQGNLTSRNYEKDGVKRTAIELAVDSISFVGAGKKTSDFEEVPAPSDEDIPFK